MDDWYYEPYATVPEGALLREYDPDGWGDHSHFCCVCGYTWRHDESPECFDVSDYDCPTCDWRA